MIIDLLSGLSSQSWSAAAVARGQWGIVVAPQYGDNTRTPLHLTSNITGDSIPAKASISSDHCIRCGARSLVPVRSWSVVQPYHPQSGSTSPLQTPGSRSQSTDHLDLESTTFRAKSYLKKLYSRLSILRCERDLNKAPLNFVDTLILATEHCSSQQDAARQHGKKLRQASPGSPRLISFN